MTSRQHPQTKQVVNRLARAVGHLESVKTMAEEGRDCSEMLTQISAVISALHGVSKLVIEDHIKHCVTSAAQEGDVEVIQALVETLHQYIGIQVHRLYGIH
jgi:DNA-binding FrmR family transcriptional regulator